MRTFDLGSGSETYKLGIDGSVSQKNVAVGNWRTAADNGIEIKMLDGTARSFPVGWGFNGDNQLVVFSGSKALFNFNEDPALTPGLELRQCVLRFTPNRLAGFAFELRGEWGLTAAHDLQLTIGGRASKLVGFVNDSDRKNRFLYVFADKKRPLLLHRLQFDGRWETPSGGEANLRFRYVDVAGKEQLFELPGNLVIDKATNQLRYEYTKNGKKAIEFDGTLSVTPDLQIVYALGRTESAIGGTVVKDSVIRIGATLTKDSFTGNLEFEAKRTDGQKTTITIGGTFVGVLSPNAQVAAGFSFQQTRAQGLVTTTVFAFEGELKFKNGSTVSWAFKSSNAATRTISLSVGADIQLGDNASLDARLNLVTSGGKVQSVTLLLGVAF